jgi:hypothetical protein
VLIGDCCDLFINGNMVVSCDTHCVIEKLQTPFISFSYDDKVKIIVKGNSMVVWV